MTKNELGLDDESNEHLDFLEDDEAHLDPNGHSTLPYKAPYSFSNLTKQLLMFAILGIIITVIIMSIMHSRKQPHAINIPLNSSAVHNTNKATNQNISTTTTNTENMLLTPPSITPDPVMSQIGQIKPPQPAAELPQPIVPDNNLPEQPSNHNSTWQELKKSITDNSHKPAVDPANNPAINVPIGGFERTSASNQITQSQANYNYKAQEHIQELKTIITNITEELTANVNQIKELQNNLRDISRSISNVSSSVSGVDSKILNLTNTVDTLSMDVKNVKKYIQEEDLDLTANLKPSEPDLFSNTPEYVVHAVIPGRAWLKSSAGQIITVTEGDSLGDYGKIALIDASNNIVRTSSGVVFR